MQTTTASINASSWPGANLDPVGVPNADQRLETSATWSPSRSISIVSRTFRAFFSTLKNSLPGGSRRISVPRRRSALPSTLNARSPAWLSIQKSSPIENIYSRVWVLRLIGIMIGSG